MIGSQDLFRIGFLFQESVGMIFDVVSVCKPSAPLEIVVKGIGKFSKGFIKQENNVIVGMLGV
jgi:hypothetical protein